MKKSQKVMTFIITMLLSCSFMLGVVYAATDSATLN